MEKRISIVRACLFVFGLTLAVFAFGNIWTASSLSWTGGRLWMGIVDGVVALVSLVLGLGIALKHRPHATVSTTIAISAILTVIGALYFTIFDWPFFGVCNFAMAACYTGLTVALARDLPVGGSVPVQLAAEEALRYHEAA